MLNAIAEYAQGTLRIQIKGMYAERFLNACVKDEIALRGIETEGPQTITARIRVADFPRLRPHARRTRVRVRVLSRRGAPFVMHRMRRRWAFWAGFFALLGLLWSMSALVWTVEVVGCDRVSPAVILRKLEAYGLKPGVVGATLDPEDIRNRALLEIPELCWLTVRFRGSHAVVEVRERIPVPEVIDDSVPCDVYAAESGLITLLRVRAGTPVVKKDQIVQKGDKLVSSLVEYKGRQWSGSYQVHASAQVFARVWTAAETVTPLEAMEKVPTGETVTRWALEIGKWRINFYSDSRISLSACDKISKRYPLEPLEGVRLPFTLVRETYTPYDRVKTTLDAEEQGQYLLGRAQALLEEELQGLAATVTNQSAAADGGAARAQMTMETVQDIAQPVRTQTRGEAARRLP